MCHVSNTSINQFMHYGELIEYGFFGEFVQNTVDREAFRNTCNFPLSKISAPISLHISRGDATSNRTDIAKLRSKVKSILYEQIVGDPTFAHSDFVNSVNVDKLVFKYIIEFWKKHEQETMFFDDGF